MQADVVQRDQRGAVRLGTNAGGAKLPYDIADGENLGGTHDDKGPERPGRGGPYGARHLTGRIGGLKVWRDQPGSEGDDDRRHEVQV